MSSPSKTIWTVGHSNLSLEAFLEEVREIELLADVRRFPSSRKFPYFSGESLKQRKGYQWFEGLGGRRQGKHHRHVAWRVAAFGAYAAYMESEAFRQALSVLEQAALRQRTALLCAEALWWRCHRRLISDALVIRGWLVLHLPGGRAHPLSPIARLEGDTLVYDRTEPSGGE
jgi:uncharacterized protein (DUF488 family)